MLWTTRLPRAVAEDDVVSAKVEADSIEAAIAGAHTTGPIRTALGPTPRPGNTYIVTCRVQVTTRPSLPLRSV